MLHRFFWLKAEKATIVYTGQIFECGIVGYLMMSKQEVGIKIQILNNQIKKDWL